MSTPLEPFADPLLGRFAPDEGLENCWRVTVTRPEGTLGFTIAGAERPAEELLEHAYEIVADLAAFQARVRDFLEREGRKLGVPELHSVITSLNLAEVCLCWPDSPRDGMIYFEHSEPVSDGAVWRCDYIDGELRDLGCDT